MRHFPVLRRWTLRVAGAALALVAAFAVGGAASAMSRLPDLAPWHSLVTRLEPRANEIGDAFTLDDYLRREDAVFREAQAAVERASEGANPAIPNRYVPASRSSPSRFPTDFNRTQILAPNGTARGGALLVHGLSDSPYSMRAIAERLNAAGYYTLSLRMQGHGTVPGGLVSVQWEDWAAAVRMGARHVRQQVGDGAPLVLVGYSNGGALVVHYALEALENAQLPAPSKLVLVSPMIAVSPMAGITRFISLLGGLPWFEKARWLDVYPEYNPFKYNSFPANAGLQSARFTRALGQRLDEAARGGSLARFPPVLALQSVVDTTVSTPAVVSDLFDRLPGGNHEIVLFDLNRSARIDAFTRPEAILPRLTNDGLRAYTATLVTNTSPDGAAVSAYTVRGGSRDVIAEALDLEWPQDMFSLSHVALPFPPDDPLYGPMPGSLGHLTPRGERGVLIVPVENLMRTSWNPFFPYLARRIEEWLL